MLSPDQTGVDVVKTEFTAQNNIHKPNYNKSNSNSHVAMRNLGFWFWIFFLTTAPPFPQDTQ